MNNDINKYKTNKKMMTPPTPDEAINILYGTDMVEDDEMVDQLGWRLRYSPGALDKVDFLLLAELLDAYRRLVPQITGSSVMKKGYYRTL